MSDEEIRYQMTIRKDVVLTITADDIMVRSKKLFQKVPLKSIRDVEVKTEIKLFILGLVSAIVGLVLYRIGGWIITLFSIFIIVDAWKHRFSLIIYFDNKALIIRGGEKLKTLASKIREYVS
jgi:hypothetical protein